MSDTSNVSDTSNAGGADLARPGRIEVGLYLSRGASAVMQACAGLPGLHVEAFADAADLQAKVDAFDAVIIQNTAYDAGFAARVATARRLRWIRAAASGTDAFQRFGLPQRVLLTNAGDTWAACVADHAMALLLGLARGIPLAERKRQMRCWDQQGLGDVVIGLRGRTLLVVGLGAISRGVARRAEAFGMNVDAVMRSPERAHNTPHIRRVDGVGRLIDRLAEADAVVLSLPLTPQSAGLLDRRALQAMRPSALLVNVSRGGVIDEAALLEALAAGRLGGVGLDVAAVEPLPSGSLLWSYDRVCITPHVAAYDDGPGFDLLASLCRDNLCRFRDGQTLRNPVVSTGQPAAADPASEPAR